MQCIAMETIKRKGEFYTVPCGRCNFCLQNKRNDWSFRLYQELQIRPTAHFLTMTYDQEHVPVKELPWNGEHYLGLHKPDLLAFHKAVRQVQKRVLSSIRKKHKLNSVRYKDLKERWKIRYYSVGEYGSNTNRPHYHSIMYGLHPETLERFHNGRIWKRGFVKCGTVTFKSIAYVTKYCIERTETERERVQPFTVMSRRPGLGANYLDEKRKWHKQAGDHEDDYRFYVMYQGYKQRMPRYYKDRVFNEFERLRAGEKSLEESLTAYWKEIDRLAEFNDDPEQYYQEALQQKHDNIRTKSKSLNTF